MALSIDQAHLFHIVLPNLIEVAMKFPVAPQLHVKSVKRTIPAFEQR